MALVRVVVVRLDDTGDGECIVGIAVGLLGRLVGLLVRIGLLDDC